MTDRREPEGLKPCPFCGGKADAVNVNGTALIGCQDCAASQLAMTPEEWNRRVPGGEVPDVPICDACHKEIFVTPPAPSEPSETAMNRAWLAHNDLVRGLGTQEDFEAGYRSGWRDRGGK